MNVTEIKTLFRAYCDEPDETVLSNDNVVRYLQRGYDEFRRRITALNPYTFAIDVEAIRCADLLVRSKIARTVVARNPKAPPIPISP